MIKADTVKSFIFVFLLPSVALYFGLRALGNWVPAYFNVDFILILFVLVFMCRFWGVSRWLAALLGVLGISSVVFFRGLLDIGGFYVPDIWSLVDYFGFIGEWPWRLFAPIIMAGVAAHVGYFVILRGINYREVPLWFPLALLLIVVCLDFFGAVSPIKFKASPIQGNIATSTAYEVLGHLPRLLKPTPWEPVPTQSVLKQHLLERAAPAHIMSVSVESWGVMKDDTLNRQITANLKSVEGLYTVETQSRPSSVGTIVGEFRDLCGLTLLGMPSAEQASSVREHCLPNILAARGWKTYGLHGNSGLFYDRRRIYPAIGFENVWFREELDKAETTPCRAVGFPGWCDRVVFRRGLAGSNGNVAAQLCACHLSGYPFAIEGDKRRRGLL